MAISLLANAADTFGWRPCPVEASCDAASTTWGVLSASFPHGLGYAAQMYIGDWAVLLLLVVDLALIWTAWRLLPARVGNGLVFGLVAAWFGLSLLTVWFAPYPIVWALRAGT
ncbi:MAG: hypothetical protein ACREEO_07100 [Phenylobacterium sp.]